MGSSESNMTEGLSTKSNYCTSHKRKDRENLDMDTFSHTDPEDTDTEEGHVGLKTKTAVTFLIIHGMDARSTIHWKKPKKYSCLEPLE